MKYYIPTSSLNLNAILSMESVAPKDFYQNRNFGYKKWYDIPINKSDSQILLFEYPGYFDCYERGLAEYPMLIELDSDKDFPLLQDGVHYSDHTIYLNPWQTRFIFFKPSDKNTAISLLQGSLETKLLRLYLNHIDVDQAFGERYPVIDDEPNLSECGVYLDEDSRKNSIKGLLYGYYIGFLLSSDKESVGKLNTYRKINNIFSAILSTPKKLVAPNQLIELNDLFSVIKTENLLYRKLLKFEGSIERTESLLDLLREMGYEIVKNPLSDFIVQNTLDPNSQKWVKSKIAELTDLMRTKPNGLSVAKREIFTFDGLSIELDPSIVSNEDELELFQFWVNHYFSEQGYIGKVESKRRNVADDITDKAKECLGDKWQDSAIRTFLNALRHHIAGKEFTQPWDNSVLSSMAAVVLKGDDWESLLLFMQQKGMTDYRLAFALYGSMIGFANLTKDFTDILLNRDSKYVADVYKEFHNQLYNESITNSATAPVTKPVSPSSWVSNPFQRCIDAILLSQNFQELKNEKAVDYYLKEINNVASLVKYDGEFWQEIKKIKPFRGTTPAWRKLLAQAEVDLFGSTTRKIPHNGSYQNQKRHLGQASQINMFSGLNQDKYEKSKTIIQDYISQNDFLRDSEKVLLEDLRYAIGNDTLGEWSGILDHWEKLLLPKYKKNVPEIFRIDDNKQNRDAIIAIKARLLTL